MSKLSSDMLPLENIRICDFTIVWAGQSSTMYLADLGADCIRVENPYIWNPATRASAPIMTPEFSALLPPWMGGHPPNGRAWNNSPAFIHVFRNKKSITVDSRRPEGLEIVKNLIRISDVVAENLATGTLEKLGLDDKVIKSVRPDAVILHIPAYGRTGAYRKGRGYGAHIDSVAGSSMLRGYPDSAPATNTQIFAGDFFVGMHGAIAMLAALRYRNHTGEGQVIELAQAECSASMFPQAALDAAWNNRESTTIGNRSIEGFVPNGVFLTRKKATEDDRWIAISCRSNSEWRSLVNYMGAPEWTRKGDLNLQEGRSEVQDMIEEKISDFTITRDRDELFRDLQQAGVTAGPVLSAADAVDDEHLLQSRAWQNLPASEDYPEALFPGPPFHFSRSNVSIRKAPAALGVDNDYLYKELLGLDDEIVAQLKSDGHITESFSKEILGEL